MDRSNTSEERLVELEDKAKKNTKEYNTEKTTKWKI